MEEPSVPGSNRKRGRKSTPSRASEAVDEKPLPSPPKPPRVIVRRRKAVDALTPALPSHEKRSRKGSTKYSDVYAVAMPTKSVTDKPEEETSNNRYGRGKARSKSAAAVPDADLYFGRRSKNGAAGPGPISAAVQWEEILDYIDGVAESGMLSQAHAKRLRVLGRQQSEPLRKLHAACAFSTVRFVCGAQELLK